MSQLPAAWPHLLCAQSMSTAGALDGMFEALCLAILVCLVGPSVIVLLLVRRAKKPAGRSVLWIAGSAAWPFGALIPVGIASVAIESLTLFVLAMLLAQVGYVAFVIWRWSSGLSTRA